MLEVLCAPHFVGSGLSYMEYYHSILQHQTKNLLKAGSIINNCKIEVDEEMTKSHEMLICLLWLERIDSRLPELVTAKFAKELAAGTNIIDLVPNIAYCLEELLDSCLNIEENYMYNPPKTDESEEGVSLLQEAKESGQVPVVEEFLNIKLEQESEEAARDDGFISFEEDLKPDLNAFDDDPSINDKKAMFLKEESIDPPLPDLNLISTPKKPAKRRKKKKAPAKAKVPKVKIKKEETVYKRPDYLDEPLECDICQQFSTNIVAEFRKHKKEVHQLDVRWCRMCNNFVDPNNINPSHLAHAKDIKCEDCDYVAPTQAKLRNHRFKIHSEGTGHQCEICGFRATCMSNMVKHRLSHKLEPMHFMCNECGETFYRMSTLKDHMKKVHEGFKYKCDYCDYTCSARKNVLDEHIKRVHLGTVFEVCMECGAKVGTKRDLLTHKATIHGKGKIYPCTKCDYKAVTNQRLQEHDRRVHEKIFFKCAHCPSQFVRKYALKRHTQTLHKSVAVHD
eukprot:TRINITY_DN34534_c0_g1_i4.p1 TRINITY_DN34534_c0_g1~~TRINITY_DN34534_c0_g1_i4.p1  ORF type:complete len:522 (-),score=114.34 TRINITY_DN34534_c0_g1_i4:45-1565(-)